MKRMKLLPAGITMTALLFLAASSGQAYTMVWESNNFDTDAGNWLVTYNETANGNNVQWLNSSQAGGTAGELGGTFARHMSSAFFGRYLDDTVTLNDPLHMRGVFSSTNTAMTWNNSVSIGYFNSTEALADSPANFLVWRNREPSSGGVNPFRARARISAQSQLNSTTTFVQGQSYTFDVQWSPSGLNDGSGTFSGTIGGWTFSQAYGAQTSGSGFDMFGLYWDESGTDATVKCDAYFDNFEYLVPGIPEPSAIWLGFLGLGVLGVAQRLRAARRA